MEVGFLFGWEGEPCCQHRAPRRQQRAPLVAGAVGGTSTRLSSDVLMPARLSRGQPGLLVVVVRGLTALPS
jgi:hypothetical protein